MRDAWWLPLSRITSVTPIPPLPSLTPTPAPRPPLSPGGTPRSRCDARRRGWSSNLLRSRPPAGPAPNAVRPRGRHGSPPRPSPLRRQSFPARFPRLPTPSSFPHFCFALCPHSFQNPHCWVLSYLFPMHQSVMRFLLNLQGKC